MRWRKNQWTRTRVLRHICGKVIWGLLENFSHGTKPSPASSKGICACGRTVERGIRYADE